MNRAAWLALALLLPFTAGCLGSVDAAEIPSQTIQNKGWRKVSDSTESLAAGLGEKVTKEYRPRNDPGTTGVIVVSVNDVPLLDERQFIPQALEQVEQQRGISFREAGTTQLSLLNLDTDVTADVYDFQKGSANGKAVLFTPDCSAFVVVVGYGVTGAGGLSGTSQTYNNARDVSRAVAC